MTENQNVAIVRRLTEEGFIGGKVAVVDDVVAESCVDHDPLPGQPQGREGQRVTCQMVVDGLSDRSIEEFYLAAGDKVVENWVCSGTHTGEFLGIPPTGKRIHVRGMEIWRLDGGQIVERWGVIDSGDLLQQLGLTPA
jgi:steroid delta-isomerase-like uncharacterized protein